ncbi:MAG: TonB-dependent receptor [Candidatus Eremiobacteraeota bacterium]|nr:TonB-dependent receptor [Candidatus Eremiobacteraeota bacterium]
MSFRVSLRALCAASVFILTAAAAASAQTMPSPSPSPLSEIGHVQTSDRSLETVTSAARTTYVVTKEQMLRNGYRSVADAIASLPGVEISHYGGVGSSVQLGVRGSGSTQVLVLIDGIAAPGSFAGSVNLGVMPISGVQRVEVVEGGGSTLYGSGAIGGIINIITDAQQSKSNADLLVGSFGDQSLRLGTGAFAFERTIVKNAYSLPDSTTRLNSDYMATTLHAGLNRTVGSIELALRAGITDDHLGAPGPSAFTSITSRENDVNGYFNVALSHRTAQARSTLQLGGSVQQIGFGCDAVNDPNCFLPSVAVSREGSSSLNFRNEVTGAASKLLYGIDLSRGVVRSDSGGTATPGVSTNALAQAALYVQDTVYSGNRGRFYAGLRAERDGALGGEVSPSLGFIAPLSPTMSLKGNFATAFRAPNASELYFPGYGNPGLHAERAQVADLSISDAHLLGGTSLGWFTNRTNNLIVPTLIDPVTFLFAPENIDHASLQGFTFETRTVPFHHITVALNVTDLYRATDLDAQKRLPNDPVISANLALIYTGTAQSAIESAGISLRSLGARGPVRFSQPAFDQPVAFTNVDAYVRWHLSKELLLSVRGQNLGNERFAEASGFPMPGRAFALELSTH